jgi:hypothetical protein
MIRVHRAAVSAAPFQRVRDFQNRGRFLVSQSMSRHEQRASTPQSSRHQPQNPHGHELQRSAKRTPQNPKRLVSTVGNAVSTSAIMILRRSGGNEASRCSSHERASCSSTLHAVQKVVSQVEQQERRDKGPRRQIPEHPGVKQN